MQGCEYYVDSEEDEVFFGCVNEKEKTVSSKVGNRQDSDVSKGENVASESGFDDSLGNDDEFCSLLSNNTSIDLDHNYSCTKQKIDKNILSTPNSVVKADKDGGFLKVLSEIALVKAEADSSKLDEDKENKNCLPDIKVTEATPEKLAISSPLKSAKSQFRRFRLLYNSPNTNDNIDSKQKMKAKSFTDSLGLKESAKKCTNQGGTPCGKVDKSGELNEVKKSRGNSWPNSIEECNVSINLIDLTNDLPQLNDHQKGADVNQKVTSISSKEQIKSREESITKIDVLAQGDLVKVQEIQDGHDEINPKENEKCQNLIDISNSQANTVIDEVQEIINPISIIESNEGENLKEGPLTSGPASSDSARTEEINGHNGEKVEEPVKVDLEEENLIGLESLEINSKLNEVAEKPVESGPTLRNQDQLFRKTTKLPQLFRFSKDARKIVNVLKESTVDDTLNFTIPEINVEDIEDSFIQSEAAAVAPGLDDTVLMNKNVGVKPPVKPSSSSSSATPAPAPPANNIRNVVSKESKPVEREPVTKTPSSISKIHTFQYFSDRKIQPGMAASQIKCARKLPVPERTPVPEKDGHNVQKKLNLAPTSKIPVGGLKMTRLPVSSTNVRPGVTKLTPAKTPSGKLYKNPKFKNVSSPINAYIHNKPTTLIVNVKPEEKKGPLMSVASSQPVKVQKETPRRGPGLPFVEYRSATPYKLEKRPESRLPRLAPNIQKLIGTNSPRILKHKGRFYVKTPTAKEIPAGDTTIMADPNEVSLVVSQVAQRSNALK